MSLKNWFVSFLLFPVISFAAPDPNPNKVLQIMELTKQLSSFISEKNYDLAQDSLNKIYKIQKSMSSNHQTLVFNKYGDPKNCAALIAVNIEGYSSGKYSAEEALGSINRNCGRYGYSW